jgi:hypothetical protein
VQFPCYGTSWSALTSTPPLTTNRGTDPNHVNGWAAHVKKAIANGATHLLGLNEPDNAGQAHLTPQAAATAWKKYMQPVRRHLKPSRRSRLTSAAQYAGKLKLVSPAVTDGPAPGGLAWLDAFFAACAGCTVDAVAIHIYNQAANIAYFQSYIPSGTLLRRIAPQLAADIAQSANAITSLCG